jgi:hypothetical protein
MAIYNLQINILKLFQEIHSKIFRESYLKSIKSNKKYEINREKIINFIISYIISKKVVTDSNILFFTRVGV